MYGFVVWCGLSFAFINLPASKSKFDLLSMVDAVERLSVLLTQEDVSYRTLDYLGRLRHLANDELALAGEPMDSDGASPPSPKKRKGDDGEYTEVTSQGVRCRGPSASVINKHWREKICEWAYQGEI
jgi:hypothetical protein